MRKKYIQKRFELSLDTYEKHAVAQSRIASVLFSLCEPSVTTPPHRILELGCGTGFLTRQLRQAYPEAQLFLNDLNERASAIIHSLASPESTPPCLFFPGDAETINLPLDLDLIISSSTFQWFNDLPSFFPRIHSLLKKESTFAFSTFSPDNLGELRCLSGKGLDYVSEETITSSLVNSQFSITHASRDTIKLSFPSPLDVLHHLKFTGVNAGFSTHWTKKSLAEFCSEYSRLFPSSEIEGGVTLTYTPLYFITKSL